MNISIREQAVIMARQNDRPVIVWQNMHDDTIVLKIDDKPPSPFYEVVGVVYPEDMP